MKLFKRKSRAEIIDITVTEILHDIMIRGFSSSEVATILNSLKDQGKIALQFKKEVEEKELLETVNAINSL